MAENQTVASTLGKRRRITPSGSNQVVPCNECIRIQLKLIKSEGRTEFLEKKSNKQAEKIKDLVSQIKLLERRVQQVEHEKQQLVNEMKQNKSVVSVLQILLFTTIIDDSVEHR